MNIGLSAGMTWRGLVCGAVLFCGHGFCSAVAAHAGTGLSAQAGDAGNANPYAVIVVQNPFRLNAPQAIETVPRPPPDLPEVIFGGTMINAGQMRAMFDVKSKEAGVKPGVGPQETTAYMCLAEGDTSGPVQLLKIMKGGEEVEIVNSGTRLTLTMKENGFAKELSAPRGGGPAGAMRTLPAVNPNIPMPASMPGRAGAPQADYGKLSVGGFGGEWYPGSVNMAGRNAAGIIRGGNDLAASPATPAVPTGMNALPNNAPGNLGSASSLPPNNTPIATIPTRNVEMPPVPPMPGQQKE